MAAYAVPAQAATTGTLKVKVTVLETGAPAPAGCVTAVDWAGYHVATKVCTTTSGAYSFTGLAVGTYKLVFAFSGFPTQELTPDTSGYSVTTLRVTAGATTASAYGLVPNHSISGKLTDTANAPLDAVTVAAVPVQGTAGSEVRPSLLLEGATWRWRR